MDLPIAIPATRARRWVNAVLEEGRDAIWLVLSATGFCGGAERRLWCSVVQNANLGQTQLFRSAPIFNVSNVPAVYLHHKNVPAPQKMHYKIGLS